MRCRFTIFHSSVRIRRGMRPYVSYPPLSVRFTAGSDVEMSCPTWGYEQPNVTWYKDYVLVKVDSRVRLLKDDKSRPNRTLAISDIRDGDRAVYKCTATNRHGTMSRTSLLRVVGMYEVLAPSHTSDTRSIHGNETALERYSKLQALLGRVISRKLTWAPVFCRLQLNSLPGTVLEIAILADFF